MILGTERARTKAATPLNRWQQIRELKSEGNLASAVWSKTVGTGLTGMSRLVRDYVPLTMRQQAYRTLARGGSVTVLIVLAQALG